mgnify:CR=1 FL=1
MQLRSTSSDRNDNLGHSSRSLYLSLECAENQKKHGIRDADTSMKILTFQITVTGAVQCNTVMFVDTLTSFCSLLVRETVLRKP